MLTISNGVLLSASPEDVRARIDKLVVEITSDQNALSQKMVRLGIALNEVKVLRYWEGWGFDSYNRYLGSLKDKVAKGRTQLYGYQSVVEKLLPIAGEETLEKMGITKATELVHAMRITGRVPSEALLLEAANPKVTAEKLREKIADEWRIFRPEEKEKWFDIGGFFATKDEVREIEQAFEVATRTDPAIPADWPEDQRRKECTLRMAREYFGTYAELVRRGEG